MRYSRLFWICTKKHEEKIVNSYIKIYANKIEKKILFKIKAGYYLELLTPETMKLIGIFKSKIAEDENDENVPY